MDTSIKKKLFPDPVCFELVVCFIGNRVFCRRWLRATGCIWLSVKRQYLNRLYFKYKFILSNLGDALSVHDYLGSFIPHSYTKETFSISGSLQNIIAHHFYFCCKTIGYFCLVSVL